MELNGIEMTGNFTDQADIDRLMSQAPLTQTKYEELGQRCMNHSDGSILQYIGTAATVRDMVAMAHALDGPGGLINYWGQSYGTLLGAWFIGSELAFSPSRPAVAHYIRIVFPDVSLACVSLSRVAILMVDPACRTRHPRRCLGSHSFRHRGGSLSKLRTARATTPLPLTL